VCSPPEEGGGFVFRVGPEGATAYDPISGASVVVPAGVLTEATEIACMGFVGYSDLAAAFADTAGAAARRGGLGYRAASSICAGVTTAPYFSLSATSPARCSA
jgi:hypothetical protein